MSTNKINIIFFYIVAVGCLLVLCFLAIGAKNLDFADKIAVWIISGVLIAIWTPFFALLLRSIDHQEKNLGGG